MKYYVICMKMSRIIKPITKKFGDFGPVKQKRHSPQLNAFHFPLAPMKFPYVAANAAFHGVKI